MQKSPQQRLLSNKDVAIVKGKKKKTKTKRKQQHEREGLESSLDSARPDRTSTTWFHGTDCCGPACVTFSARDAGEEKEASGQIKAVKSGK